MSARTGRMGARVALAAVFLLGLVAAAAGVGARTRTRGRSEGRRALLRSASRALVDGTQGQRQGRIGVQSQSQKTRMHTFIDSSGSFPGMGHCVQGILKAHLQAREANIRVADLPTFMREYCEEDIATALGTTLPQDEGARLVWRAAHGIDSSDNASLVVTRHHSVVRLQSADVASSESGPHSEKLALVHKTCARLSELYQPQCCRMHQPCCTSVWRSRFANRPDALRYCRLVREAVSGRFSLAERMVAGEADKLNNRIPLPSLPAPRLPTSSLCTGEHAKSLECGRLSDGSRLNVDAGRSLPSFGLQAKRVEEVDRVRGQLAAATAALAATKQKVADVEALLSKRMQTGIVDFRLRFVSTYELPGRGESAIAIATLKRAVQASLVGVSAERIGVTKVRDCGDADAACSDATTPPRQRGQHFDYEVSISLDLPSRRKADTVGRILKREAYGKTLLRSFSRAVQNGTVTWARVNGIRVDSSRPMPPPSWFRAQLSNKLAQVHEQLRLAELRERLGRHLLVLVQQLAQARIDLALLTQAGKPSTAAEHRVERLSLERELVSLNMTAAEVDGKIISSIVSSPEHAMLVQQRETLTAQVKAVVQRARMDASLGALSRKADKIAVSIETASDLIARAQLESQLAELNDMRARLVQEVKRDQVHADRMHRLREAAKRHPEDMELQKRIKAMARSQMAHHEMMMKLTRSGDHCGVCRARIMSVMQDAIKHSVKTAHLPGYMESYCETRLAITGPASSLRDPSEISRICSTFRDNLKHDLQESEHLRLQEERSDSAKLGADASHYLDGGVRPGHFRRSDDDGHSATIHTYCLATSQCLPPTEMHPSREPESKCDRCASELMGVVDRLRGAAAAAPAQPVVVGSLTSWCTRRLESRWSLRRDLINATCHFAVFPGDGKTAFAHVSTAQLGPEDEAHADLQELYSFCAALGDCHRHESHVKTASEVDQVRQLADEAAAKRKLVDQAEKSMEEAERRAGETEDAEARAEEVATRQQEAVDLCDDKAKALAKQEAQEDSEQEAACVRAASKAKELDELMQQLTNHEQDVARLQEDIAAQSSQCEETHEDSSVRYHSAKEAARKRLASGVAQINSQLSQLLQRTGEDNSAEEQELRDRIAELEQKSLEDTSAALKSLEDSDSSCKAQLEALKGAHKTGQQLVLEDRKRMSTLRKLVESLHLSCATATKRHAATQSALERQKAKCADAASVAEATARKAANARAQSAGVKAAEEVARQRVESVEGPTGATGATGSATGATGATGITGGAKGATGATGVTGAASSEAASTRGECALTVLTRMREYHGKGLEQHTIMAVMASWALRMCTAEADAARSRAEITGHAFTLNPEVACSHAATIFHEAVAGASLLTSLKFCRILRQFTGTPKPGPRYKPGRALLPLAPLSLRREAYSSRYTFGPGPILDGRPRSLETVATHDEIRNLKTYDFGQGNLDSMSASDSAELAARTTQKPDLIIEMERRFEKKWKDSFLHRGGKFETLPDDPLPDPMAHFRIPDHRKPRAATVADLSTNESAATATVNASASFNRTQPMPSGSLASNATNASSF